MSPVAGGTSAAAAGIPQASRSGKPKGGKAAAAAAAIFALKAMEAQAAAARGGLPAPGSPTRPALGPKGPPARLGAYSQPVPPGGAGVLAGGSLAGSVPPSQAPQATGNHAGADSGGFEGGELTRQRSKTLPRSAGSFRTSPSVGAPSSVAGGQLHEESCCDRVRAIHCWPRARDPCHLVYKVLSVPDSLSGHAFAWLVMVAIIVSIVIMCIDSTRESREARIRGAKTPVLDALEAVAVGLFTVEFFGRLLTVTSAPLSDQYSAEVFGSTDDELDDAFAGDDDPGYADGAGTASDASRSEATGAGGGGFPADSSAPAQATAAGSQSRAGAKAPANAAVQSVMGGEGGPKASPLEAHSSASVGGQPSRTSKLAALGRSRSIDGYNECAAAARKEAAGDIGDDDTSVEPWHDLGETTSAEALEHKFARAIGGRDARARTRALASYKRSLWQRGREFTCCWGWCFPLQRLLCSCCLLPPCCEIIPSAGKPRSLGRVVWSRLCSPRARLKLWVFWTSAMNIIDLAAIAPFYTELVVMALDPDQTSGNGVALSVLRVLRVARVLRVLKLGRRSSGFAIISKALAKSAYALFLTFFFVFLGIVLFGAIMFYSESGEFDQASGLWLRPDTTGTGVEESPFSSIMAAFWFW